MKIKLPGFKGRTLTPACVWLQYTPGSFQAVAPPPSTNTTSQKNKGRKTVLKKGAGYVWEDQTLLEWDPAWFRVRFSWQSSRLVSLGRC